MQEWSKLEINLSLIHFSYQMVRNTATCRMIQGVYRTFTVKELQKNHFHMKYITIFLILTY
jgi:hypothetical protein